MATKPVKTPELEAHWTLDADEKRLVRDSHTFATRLGFALLYKYFQLYGRFPEQGTVLAPQIVDYVGLQVGALAETWQAYDLSGRTAQGDRSQIRKIFGFRRASLADLEELTGWLLEQSGQYENDPERLLDIALDRLQDKRLEPPTLAELEKIARTVAHRSEMKFCEKVYKRLSKVTISRLNGFLDPISTLPANLQANEEEDQSDEEEPDLPRAVIRFLNAGPGAANIENILIEVEKLQRIRDAKVPADVFGDTPLKLIYSLKKRACVEDPYELERHPSPLKMTLLSAFSIIRAGQVTDNLVDQLIEIIHKIGVKAEQRLDKQLRGDLKRTLGKFKLLYQIAIACTHNPEGKVKDVVFGAVPKKVLEEIIREYEASGQQFETKVRDSVLRSYGGHYRRMLPHILRTLEFRTNTRAHEPLIKSIDLIKRHLDDASYYYPEWEVVPTDRIITDEWQELIYREDSKGMMRIHRLPYEMAVLQALREALRCREVWVVGAIKYRNPDDDLPADFEKNRASYYDRLKLPLDPWGFLNPLRTRMAEELTALNKSILKNPDVEITDRNGGWIKLSPYEPQEEPENIISLKAEVNRRWNQTAGLDVLNEADHRVGFLKVLKSPTKRENMSAYEKRRRLLLTVYALGTNVSIKTMCNDEDSPLYKDLLYVRRRMIHKEELRTAIQMVLNATLKARQPWLWGESSSACASDSKKFSIFEQNLRAEYHNRYRGRGVMIYWHVDKKALCIYSQMKTCSSSEVASMIEGVLRHCTEMSVEKQYVDTHGQSEVAFAFTRLLGFDLMPRLKGIHVQKLYRPSRSATYPNLEQVTSRAIDWQLIAKNYDQMVKHVAGLRFGNANSETILRRFTRNNADNELYRAFTELGRVEKTIFLCQYLRSKEIRQEIHEGLNVIENWNSANNYLFFGKGREFASNRPDDQEESMLSLHLLQSCLVLVNTLMIQRVLEEPEWKNRLSLSDFRAITPMIYSHVNPYGQFILDPEKRLPIDEGGDRYLEDKMA